MQDPDNMGKVFQENLLSPLWNPYGIYIKMGGTERHLDFQLRIVNKIMKKYQQEATSARAGRLSSTPKPLQLSRHHFPDYLHSTEKKIDHTSQCTVCSCVHDHM